MSNQVARNNAPQGFLTSFSSDPPGGFFVTTAVCASGRSCAPSSSDSEKTLSFSLQCDVRIPNVYSVLFHIVFGYWLEIFLGAR